MSHHIDGMVNALVSSGAVQKIDHHLAEAVLRHYLRDRLVRYWHIDDVFELAPYLSDDEARQVLAHVDETHDANVGINWDVLEAAIEYLNFKRD